MTVIFGRLLQKLRHKNQRVFKVVIQTWHRWAERALQLRLYANINEDEIIVDGNTLIYRTLDCRVQNARKRKGMEFHPCKAVGVIEYTGFAKTIDDRFECEALSCYPEITDETCNCSWKFILKDN